MIDLGTLAGLREHDHKLHAHCPRCEGWVVLPLAELVTQGKGPLRLPVRVRCRDCGKPRNLQVRPPITVRCSLRGSAQQPQVTLL